METNRLKAFCLIAEMGSLTKASELLNVSHSALSKSMAQLQRELNLNLLRPLGRGLEITEEGKILHQKCQQLLPLINELSKSNSMTLNPHLKIGLTEIFSLSLVGKIADKLSTQLDFLDLDSGQIEVMLLEERIDLGLTFLPFPHPQLEYLKIKKIEMGVFSCDPSFKKQDLREVSFVVPFEALKDNPLSVKNRDGWPFELERKITYRANTLAAALKIVKSRLAVIYIPHFLAKLLNFELKSECQLLEVPSHGLINARHSREIFIVKKKSLPESNIMKKIAQIIRKEC